MELKSRYLWLVLPPAAVGLAGEAFIERFAGPGPAYQTLAATATPAMLAQEQASRLSLLAFLLLLVCVSAGIVGKFIADCLTHYRGASRIKLLITAALGAVAAIYVVMDAPSGPWSDGVSLLGEDLYARAGALAEPDFGAGRVRFLLAIASVVSGAGIAALVVGAVSCLGQSAAHPEGAWKSQSERLQLYVYLGTAMLVAGVLFIEAWSHWPSFAFIVDDKGSSPDLAAFDSHANALTIFNGIQYSVMLASYAIPVAAALFAQADALARSRIAGGTAMRTTVPEEREAAGLSITIMNQVKALAMILMPFLASTFDKLTGLIGGP